jgi:hypothetical protein
VIRHRMEVSLLSHEVMLRINWVSLNLYPLDYRTAFAFSILPYPQSCGLALRFAFPGVRTSFLEKSRHRENYGLTTFRVSARVG